MLAKWLNAKPEIMILSNPTQGVDVGAKNEIYGLIMDLAKQGLGIIITSGEAQEIMKICDRVLVMEGGKIAEEGKFDELIRMNGLFARLVERERMESAL